MKDDAVEVGAWRRSRVEDVYSRSGTWVPAAAYINLDALHLTWTTLVVQDKILIAGTINFSL